MERRAHGFLKCVGTKDSDRTIELRGTELYGDHHRTARDM
jgi:hypothetical protein